MNHQNQFLLMKFKIENDTKHQKSTKFINEPRHDKTNKMAVRPAKTQISLGIREESLGP